MIAYKQAHSAHVRATLCAELLDLRTKYPSARFVQIELDDENRGHEYEVILVQVADSNQTPLCTSDAYLDDYPHLPQEDGLLTWLSYEDFLILVSPGSGIRGHLPLSVLANPGKTWTPNTYTYIFDLDVLSSISQSA